MNFRRFLKIIMYNNFNVEKYYYMVNVNEDGTMQIIY
jgi:hypothetical protein